MKIRRFWMAAACLALGQWAVAMPAETGAAEAGGTAPQFQPVAHPVWAFSGDEALAGRTPQERCLNQCEIVLRMCRGRAIDCINRFDACTSQCYGL